MFRVRVGPLFASALDYVMRWRICDFSHFGRLKKLEPTDGFLLLEKINLDLNLIRWYALCLIRVM